MIRPPAGPKSEEEAMADVREDPSGEHVKRTAMYDESDDGPW